MQTFWLFSLLIADTTSTCCVFRRLKVHFLRYFGKVCMTQKALSTGPREVPSPTRASSFMRERTAKPPVTSCIPSLQEGLIGMIPARDLGEKATL